MKESTRNAFHKIAALTRSKCETCPVTEAYRCCDKLFCNMVAASLKEKGINIKPTGHPTVPFMGESGCVVPPEHRPYCSTFVCVPHLKNDRKFRKEYAHIRTKIEQDPCMSDVTFPRLETWRKNT